MMDPRTIRDLSDQAARKARREGREPYGFFDASDVDRSARRIPFLGSYVPRGYRLVETLFVDSSGFGAPGEPAMTFPAFLDRVRRDVREGNAYSYAIVESGQFQVYVGVYKTVPVRTRKPRPVDRRNGNVPELGFTPRAG